MRHRPVFRNRALLTPAQRFFVCLIGWLLLFAAWEAWGAEAIVPLTWTPTTTCEDGSPCTPEGNVLFYDTVPMGVRFMEDIPGNVAMHRARLVGAAAGTQYYLHLRAWRTVEGVRHFSKPSNEVTVTMPAQVVVILEAPGEVKTLGAVWFLP